MNNAFTGKPLTRNEINMTPYLEGQKQKALDDMEIIETGTGPAPKSRGRSYPGPEDVVTDQTGRDQADINFIMKRIQKTGQLADVIAQGLHSENGMFYGDFTDMPTFQESLNIVNHARDQFMLLDAHVRNRFDNDPAKFLQFMSDDRNMEEQHKLGLRAKKPVTEPETTLKDVVNAVKEAAKPPKKAPKGGDSED